MTLAAHILVMKEGKVDDVIYATSNDNIKVGDRLPSETTLPNGKKITTGHLVIKEIRKVTENGSSYLEIYAEDTIP